MSFQLPGAHGRYATVEKLSLVNSQVRPIGAHTHPHQVASTSDAALPLSPADHPTDAVILMHQGEGSAFQNG